MAARFSDDADQSLQTPESQERQDNPNVDARNSRGLEIRKQTRLNLLNFRSRKGPDFIQAAKKDA